MPLIPPRLLAPDDASKRKEEKLGTSMWSNSFVFEELRNGFQPVFDRYHAKTTANSVRQADIGCKILRAYTNRQYRTVPGQQGGVKAISPDGKQTRVLLQGCRIDEASGQPISDNVPVGVLRGGYRPYGQWRTVVDFPVLLMPKTEASSDEIVESDTENRFATAVKALLRTFLSAKLNWSPLELMETLGHDGENIDAITKKIVDGASSADSLNALNEEGFSIHNIILNTAKVEDHTGQPQHGIYCRPYYEDYDNNKRADKLYVGRSSSFREHWHDYKHKSHPKDDRGATQHARMTLKPLRRDLIN
jgi:hypothetical protein